MTLSSPNDLFSRSGSDHSVFAPSPAQNANHSHGHHAEDAYEAVMRAADALFAPPSRAVDTTDGATKASMTARDAKPDLDALFAAPSAVTSDLAADASQPGRGGRILRVLDEEPEPALIALEAERAPKRRGRRPGSKNKPKEGFSAPQRNPAAKEPAHFIFNHAAAPVITAGDNPIALRDPAPSPSAATERSMPRRAASVQKASITPVAAAQEAAPIRPGNRATATADGTVRSEPFSWVRVKLAPGERWKRRLPKVCW